MKLPGVLPAMSAAMMLAVTACGGSDQASDQSADNALAMSDAGSELTTPGAAGPVPGFEGAIVTLAVAPTGNEARYRVRERLVGFELPNDAVGATGAVSGSLAIGADGAFLPGSSIVVDITGLESDESRRDGYLQNRLLGGAEYPTVTLTPSELRGLTLPLPASGTTTATIVGDLTVRNVTRPTTWQVEASFDGERITGTAVTGFTFEDFQMTKPSVPVVLSVADTIHLEYDFNLLTTVGQ